MSIRQTLIICLILSAAQHCLSKVLEITSTNIANALKIQPSIETLFYHTQCPQSRFFKEEFSQIVNIKNKDTNFGLIDCFQ